MKNWMVLLTVILTLILITTGCSGGGIDPITPDTDSESCLTGDTVRSPSGTQLWGYYTIELDPDAPEAIISLNRTAMFTANCTNLLNKTLGGGLGISFNNVDNQPDYIDFDLTVAITHPFPGLPQFHGYDVRGLFMGNGSEALLNNPDLRYPVIDVDQSLQPGFKPDGYSRWYNFSEFQSDQLPLFAYTDGQWGDPEFSGNATLCPYMYFADGLADDENLSEWLATHADQNGQFSSGATNGRDYEIRFPKSMPMSFGYAIIASWTGTEPIYHPSNAHEAVACEAVEDGTLYWSDESTWGGDMHLVMDIYDWEEHTLSGAMEDYRVIVESTALLDPYMLDSTEMVPTGNGDNFYSYEVTIPADNLTSGDDNEFWVIVETADYDYSNEFGIMNDAWDEPLTAFFRYDLEVSNIVPTQNPVCDIQINECTLHFWDITDHVQVEFDASGSYDPDGDPLTYHWDFDGDDQYDEPGDDDYVGDPWNPRRDYYEDGVVSLKLEDDMGGSAICTADVDVTEHPSKNIPLRPSPWIARDLAVDPANGDLHVLYYWNDTADDKHWTETYKYSPCDLYSDPGGAFHTANEGAKYFRIDVSSTHYSLIGGGHTGCSGKVRNITPDGIDIGPNWVIHTVDLWAFNDGTEPWPLDHVTLYGWGSPPWNPGGHNTYVYRAPYPDTFDDWYQAAVVYWGDETWTGYDRIYGNHVRGCEPVASGNSFWAVKDAGTSGENDYWGTLWRLDDPGTFTGVNWDGEWFGVGYQTENDEGWYDAQDMTRDANDNLLVLDMLSDGSGRIKAFVGDDTGGAPVAAMDVPDEINNTPISVDSSDYYDPLYGNLLYVLHGDSNDWYYLSIFFEDETPW